MATTERVCPDVTVAQVLASLHDGFSYGRWVVGTRKIRAVDEGWPQPPARLHYTVGHWPIRKDGTTTSLEVLAGEGLVLEAEGWPLGTVRIEIRVTEVDGATTITIDERPERGPGAVLHNPLVDAFIWARNIETLRRLEADARGRQPAVSAPDGG